MTTKAPFHHRIFYYLLKIFEKLQHISTKISPGGELCPKPKLSFKKKKCLVWR